MLPKKGVQLEKDKKSTKSSTSKPTAVPADAAPKVRAPRKKQAPKVKPPPAISWKKLRVNLPVSEVEARMYIREFVVRFFYGESSISKTHMEELEEIAGKAKGREDEEEMVGWVSDQCVKSVVLRLLEILADQEINGGIQKVSAVFEEVYDVRANYFPPQQGY